jgi:hypothetical protein
MVPLGIFLIPSVNPSSWALTSAGLLWISLVGYFESSGWRKTGLGSLAVITAFMGGGARSDSAAYSILSVGVAVILTVNWSSFRYWLSALLPLGIVILSTFLYFSGSQSRSPLGQGDITGNPATLAFRNLLEVPWLWAGALGTDGLGWRDTAMPASVWVIGLLCFGALTFSGLRAMNIRKGLILGGISVMLVVLPVAILVSIRALVGPWLQPRYLLPLIVILAGVALFQVGSHRIALTRTQWAVLGIGLTAVQSAALHENIRRYVTGNDVYGWNLSANVEWWWGLPFGPMALWLAVSLLFGALIALAVSEFRSWVDAPISTNLPQTRQNSDLDDIPILRERGYLTGA